MTKSNPVVLDCTFRDGGYYNQWNFNTEIVNQYLNAMEIAKVDVVELGFRFLKSDEFLGPCAFSKDNFLKNLKIPSSLEVAVMINCSDLINESGWKKTMEVLFPNRCKESPVSIIRFACHFKDLETGFKASTWAQEQGYKVGVNLMQISNCTEEQIDFFTTLANRYPVDVLYIADSTGSLRLIDVQQIIQRIRSNWTSDIGVHMHDNLGLALSNTLEGYKEGANWLDSTITGMGRGPGNTKTEELLIELTSEKDMNTILPILSLIENYFNPMKDKYKWGTNPFYFLSGKLGIHPTFIQEALTDTRFNEKDKFAIIKFLTKKPNKKFNHKLLEESRNFYQEEISGSWAPKKNFLDREVLVVGTGPSVSDHKLAIEQFIKKNKPLVLALNSNEIIDNNLIDFRVACHPLRIFSDVSLYSKLESKIIIPGSILSELEIEIPSSLETLDYGLSVQENKFQFDEYSGISPSPIVLGYTLLLCCSGRARNIILTGIDGFSDGDARNTEIENLLNLYHNHELTPKIYSITPTRFDLKIDSVYNNI